MPGLCASGITGKLSSAKLTALASTVRGETTSVLKDMRKLFVPVIALAITYEKVIKPGSIMAYREVNNFLTNGNRFEGSLLSWIIAKPSQLLKALWNLPCTCKGDRLVNFLQNRVQNNLNFIRPYVRPTTINTSSDLLAEETVN